MDRAEIKAEGFSRPKSAKSRLRDIWLKKDNQLCADCGAPYPKWASVTFSVIICLECSRVHKSLGTHISKVLSITMDEWSEDEVDGMIEVGGNARANANICEALIPDGYKKPGPSSSREERLKFIRAKYELGEFLHPSFRIVLHKLRKIPEEP